MGDFFHESINDVTRSAVLNVIGQCPQHTFILLTKRPQRIPAGAMWFENIWLGVTAENQEMADARWHELTVRTVCRKSTTVVRFVGVRNSPPVVRFVSVEPMLGPVSFNAHTIKPDWVIAGPETGPGARRCDDAWIDALAAESPCFFDKRARWTRREWPK
jgi:protein gp37